MAPDCASPQPWETLMAELSFSGSRDCGQSSGCISMFFSNSRPFGLSLFLNKLSSKWPMLPIYNCSLIMPVIFDIRLSFTHSAGIKFWLYVTYLDCHHMTTVPSLIIPCIRASKCKLWKCSISSGPSDDSPFWLWAGHSERSPVSQNPDISTSYFLWSITVVAAASQSHI